MWQDEHVEIDIEGRGLEDEGEDYPTGDLLLYR